MTRWSSKKLNAMMSVTKAAVDRFIQAALRANKKAAARLNNPKAGSGFAYMTDEGNSLPTRRSTILESDRSRQQQFQQVSVKRSDRRQPRLIQTQPLPTKEGNLTPVLRVHVRGGRPTTERRGANFTAISCKKTNNIKENSN